MDDRCDFWSHFQSRLREARCCVQKNFSKIDKGSDSTPFCCSRILTLRFLLCQCLPHDDPGLSLHLQSLQWLSSICRPYSLVPRDGYLDALYGIASGKINNGNPHRHVGLAFWRLYLATHGSGGIWWRISEYQSSGIYPPLLFHTHILGGFLDMEIYCQEEALICIGYFSKFDLSFVLLRFCRLHLSICAIVSAVWGGILELKDLKKHIKDEPQCFIFP